MRLLGVFKEDNREFFLLQDEDKFFKSDDQNLKDEFFNYDLIKNRDVLIGSEPVEGEGVFNFRYGPVTAGVKEAGVFNIYTYGERILSVNIDPSYKKRDIERLILKKNIDEGLKFAESVCGNFAVSHSLAFCRALENCAKLDLPEDAVRLRVVALELERLYNHTTVFLKLARGASQNVLTSHLSFVFEELLRINRDFGLGRFLKGVVVPGGVRVNKNANFEDLSKRLLGLKDKFEELYEHALKSYNFIDRIHNTAPLNKELALKIGVTGPTLRACGVKEDLRMKEKGYEKLSVVVEEDGDSLARMEVRVKEFLNSTDVIVDNLAKVKDWERLKGVDLKDFNGEGIGYSESPSGLLVYYVKLNRGILENVYILTPSVFGFKAFSEAFKGFIFTDFSFAFDSFGVHFSDCAR